MIMFQILSLDPFSAWEGPRTLFWLYHCIETHSKPRKSPGKVDHIFFDLNLFKVYFDLWKLLFYFLENKATTWVLSLSLHWTKEKCCPQMDTVHTFLSQNFWLILVKMYFFLSQANIVYLCAMSLCFWFTFCICI